jgi:hypothetical protein
MRKLVLVAFPAFLLAACDERRQPSNPPGTEVRSGTPSGDQGSTQPNQGGIPAGQAQPQQPQTPAN